MHRNAKQSKHGPLRNQNSIMQEDYVVFSFLNHLMKNSMKMLVERWKFRCQQRCLAEFNFISSGRLVAQLDNTRRNMLVIVEADESREIRMEGSQSKNHEDHIAERGINSLNHFDLVHKFIPVPRAMKIQKQRQQWRNNGKHSTKYRHGS